MYHYVKGRNRNGSRMLNSYNNQGDDGNSGQVIEQMWKETIADGGEIYFEDRVKKKKKACQGSNIGVEGEAEIKVTLSLGLNNMVRGEYLEMDCVCRVACRIGRMASVGMQGHYGWLLMLSAASPPFPGIGDVPLLP